MTTVPDSDHADKIKSLGLPAKVALLTGATSFTLAPNESIELGEVRLSDGPTGVRGLKFSGGRVVALLPNATLLASAWSEDTAYEVGRILAEEALAQQIHVVLGPTINLHRTALGGRLFEAYSEDPLLTGKIAAAYVRGLQDAGVGACLKHLVANESETDRNTVNSVVDEATLRELYLLPFEIAVTDSDAWSMMAAYNDVNGLAATEQQHVNNEVVKGEWGYRGLIMSDWFAAALLGDIEPAGRLVTTFPAADGKAPAWSVTPVDGELVYDEGTYLGYRGHFAGRAAEPAFWLGHGLGYTTWAYSDARLVTGDSPGVTVTLANTGDRDSREVVQIYFAPAERDEPIRLVGWKAVQVEASRSARITVPTDRRMWRRWNTATNSWDRLGRGGQFLIARGLGDIRATLPVL